MLLTNHFWWGGSLGLAVDLTLGWRLMSNQEVLDGLRLYSMPRAYSWTGRNGQLPATNTDITEHSANMHMVPATDEMAEQLRAVKRGDLIDLRGYLIQMDFPGGGVWRSSMTRSDPGNGACELVWVEELKVQ